VIDLKRNSRKRELSLKYQNHFYFLHPNIPAEQARPSGDADLLPLAIENS